MTHSPNSYRCPKEKYHHCCSQFWHSIVPSQTTSAQYPIVFLLPDH
ncbi:hypothetical protein V9T40_012506 [Parthenolecanium corni]|uniref:Uncharacterized protein n=1 Tax=Parthenolecanium corni TaxID=536013 RepID=A0AAN9T9N2_9HEMI